MQDEITPSHQKPPGEAGDWSLGGYFVWSCISNSLSGNPTRGRPRTTWLLNAQKRLRRRREIIRLARTSCQAFRYAVKDSASHPIDVTSGPDSFSELRRFRMGTVVDFHHWRTQRNFQRHRARTLHKDGNLKASVKLFETICFEYALNEDESATWCNCGEQLLRLKNELTPNPIHRYFHGCGALHET